MRLAVFDVDDVVLDMDHLARAAQRAVAEALTPHVGATVGAAVHRRLEAFYGVLRRNLRASSADAAPEFTALYARIAAAQRGVTEAGFEVKPWSRQVLVALALEDEGVSVRAAAVHAGAAAYWSTLAAGTRVLDDAARALDRARAAGFVVHLATNSDGWLRYDEAAGTFVYDPTEARALKLERLSPLWAHGLEAQDVTVGDPVGKPHAGFYRQVFDDVAAKTGAPVATAGGIAIGDSLMHDVAPFLGLGLPRGIWILRRGEAATDDGRVRVVRSLDEVEFGDGACGEP